MAGDGGGARELAGHSVALLNRGTPGSLVTPDGTLNISLMRSCSTWPCGVWIDGDKRATPDGSSFAWQHWSHTFEYALAAGPGDWRSAGFPLAGQDYSHDLLACETGRHDGPLPATASLAAAEPATAVVSALKPRGNPLSPGAAQPRPQDGVTVRLRDCLGRRGAGRGVGAPVHRVAAARRSQPARGGRRPAAAGWTPAPPSAELPPAGTVTMVLTPGRAPAAGDARDRVPPGRRRRSPPSRCSPGTGCTARARPRPGTCRWPCTSPPPGPPCPPGGADADRAAAAASCGSPWPAAPSRPRGTVRPGPRRRGSALEPAGPLRYDLGPRGHARLGPHGPGACRGRPARAALRGRADHRRRRPGLRGRGAGQRRRAAPRPPSTCRSTSCSRSTWPTRQRAAAELDLALLTPRAAAAARRPRRDRRPAAQRHGRADPRRGAAGLPVRQLGARRGRGPGASPPAGRRARPWASR